MDKDRLYGYGVGIVAGLVTAGAVVSADMAGWLFLLVVLVWAARRRTEAHDADE